MKKLLLGLITLFVFYCVYWATGRSMMLNNLTQSIQTLEAQGYDVEHKGLSAGGFPILFRSSLNEPGVVSPRSIDKPWSIKADKIVMQASTFNPLHWSATHRGEARIDLRGPKGERWLFDARPFSVNLDTRAKFGGDIKSVKADISRLKVQAVIGTLPPIVGLDQGQIDIKPHAGDLRHHISLDSIFLEKDTLTKWQTALGPKIESFYAVILAKGLTSLNQDDRKAWAKSGRYVGESWSLSWNDNIFTGDFDLTQTPSGLDGSLRAEIENLPDIIDQFAKAGMFTPQQVSALRIGSRFLPVNDNGRQDITFNFKDGYLILFGQRLHKF